MPLLGRAIVEAQIEANALSYKERYKRYLKWQKAKYPNIKPWGYEQWLKYCATSNLPADCRPGQGKEPWQKQ